MKKRLHLILGLLQLFVAIGAIPAGLSMILEPDGSGLRMTTDILKNSPFNTFLIPGLFLFIGNGVFNLIFSIFTFLRFRKSSLIGILLGVYLILWICIQVYFVRLNHFLQPTFFAVGILEVYLGWKLSIVKREKRISYYFRN